MNDRQKIIQYLITTFKVGYAEGKGTQEFTSFDEEVINALDKLSNAHRDVAVPPECASLGFVLKSEISEISGSVSCRMVPCWKGKMPYQKDAVSCLKSFVDDTESNGICRKSPMQMVKLLAGEKRETNDEA